MLPNPGYPAAVSSVKGILLYAPCFQEYFLFSSRGLKAPVFADPEAGLVLESCSVHTQALHQEHSAFPLSPCFVLM